MRANQLLRGIIVLLFSLTSLPLLYGQRMNAAYQAYIRKYANEAIHQMKRHKIPASITIAQGLLESNAGASTLASVHNNHFGIKCHKTWQGNRAYKDDDEKGECFRSYDSPLDSYTDHSYFLQQPRYKSLYQLPLDDYQGWAKGLQRCGYATDKGYANKLIALVELYSLYELDREASPSWMKGKASSPSSTPEKKREKQTTSKAPQKRTQYNCYGLEYVLAEEGDSFATIARDVNIDEEKLATFNDAPVDFPLKKGDVIYLQRKNKHGDSAQDHVVSVGESMHSISQLYGIRVEYLYKINGLDIESYVPLEGDVLRLW